MRLSRRTLHLPRDTLAIVKFYALLQSCGDVKAYRGSIKWRVCSDGQVGNWKINDGTSGRGALKSYRANERRRIYQQWSFDNSAQIWRCSWQGEGPRGYCWLDQKSCPCQRAAESIGKPSEIGAVKPWGILGVFPWSRGRVTHRLPMVTKPTNQRHSPSADHWTVKETLLTRDNDTQSCYTGFSLESQSMLTALDQTFMESISH